jgi:parvulin-like peptidyl-prolyl isomerase
MSTSPRLNPPEHLSGVPDAPVVEIAPGRPWLTVDEVNRLIRQQGLSLAVAQAWVLDEVVSTITLESAEDKKLIRTYLESQGVSSDEQLAEWLKKQRLSFEDLTYFATKSERVRRWQRRRYGEEAEIRFLERKLELDQCTYSLLRVKEQDLAEELYQRIKEGEADFAELSQRYSEGQEKKTRGLIGPVPLAAGHPDLVAKLRISRAGQLWPPFPIGDVWILVRFEQLFPAQLNKETRDRMIEELFQVWFKERVQTMMQGDPLPPLPQLPPELDRVVSTNTSEGAP